MKDSTTGTENQDQDKGSEGDPEVTYGSLDLEQIQGYAERVEQLMTDGQDAMIETIIKVKLEGVHAKRFILLREFCTELLTMPLQRFVEISLAMGLESHMGKVSENVVGALNEAAMKKFMTEMLQGGPGGPEEGGDEPDGG
jgi:hypothetical protein